MMSNYCFVSYNSNLVYRFCFWNIKDRYIDYGLNPAFDYIDCMFWLSHGNYYSGDLIIWSGIIIIYYAEYILFLFILFRMADWNFVFLKVIFIFMLYFTFLIIAFMSINSWVIGMGVRVTLSMSLLFWILVIYFPVSMF